MSRLATFFQGSDTQLGVFYPRNYLLAAFPDSATAQAVLLTFKKDGYTGDEVLAISGADVVEFGDEYIRKHGLWTVMMTELSRLIDTEQAYLDHDLELARRGAGFLAIYCPTADAKTKAWNRIAPFKPTVARYYTAAGIEHLAGET